MFACFPKCLIITLFCFLQTQSLAKEIKDVTEEMDKNKNLFTQIFPENCDYKDIIEDTLNCLLRRLTLLESVVNQRCHHMKGQLQQIVTFKVWCSSQGVNGYDIKWKYKDSQSNESFWYQMRRTRLSQIFIEKSNVLVGCAKLGTQIMIQNSNSLLQVLWNSCNYCKVIIHPMLSHPAGWLPFSNETKATLEFHSIYFIILEMIEYAVFISWDKVENIILIPTFLNIFKPFHYSIRACVSSRLCWAKQKKWR